jgi:hypothetical protein
MADWITQRRKEHHEHKNVINVGSDKGSSAYRNQPKDVNH